MTIKTTQSIATVIHFSLRINEPPVFKLSLVHTLSFADSFVVG